MGRKPSSKYSLDRIDVNGDYEPSNCRWLTPTQNNNNKRVNWVVSFDGRTHTPTEWSRELGIKANTIQKVGGIKCSVFKPQHFF